MATKKTFLMVEKEMENKKTPMSLENIILQSPSAYDDDGHDEQRTPNTPHAEELGLGLTRLNIMLILLLMY